MERYDYRKAMYDDVREYIEENAERYKNRTPNQRLREDMNEDMWCTDSVMGNASGSYTFSTWQAEENICHNGELIDEMCSEFGIEDVHGKGAEWIDVSIRCYLLSQIIDEVVDDLCDEGFFNDDEEDGEE